MKMIFVQTQKKEPPWIQKVVPTSRQLYLEMNLKLQKNLVTLLHLTTALRSLNEIALGKIIGFDNNPPLDS